MKSAGVFMVSDRRFPNAWQSAFKLASEHPAFLGKQKVIAEPAHRQLISRQPPRLSSGLQIVPLLDILLQCGGGVVPDPKEVHLAPNFLAPLPIRMGG